jgi:hypothetical protein
MRGYQLPELDRNVKPEHHRSAIGVDRLTISPPDDLGNSNVIIIVEKHSKFVHLYACKDYTAESLSDAMIRFFSENGLYEDLYSDPGSDLTSEAVAQVLKWFGVNHKLSLVDRHESNGVEPYCKIVLHSLRMFCADKRLHSRWGHPCVLLFVQWAINDLIHTETGFSPFVAKFGSESETYLKLPDNLMPDQVSSAYIKLLDANLKVIKEISDKAQREAIARRSRFTQEELQTKFQPGDFVLFQLDPSKSLPNKLSAPLTGPYKVVKQITNTVYCRDLVNSGIAKAFHISRVKAFFGTEEEAMKMAMLDKDQFTVIAIVGHCGDPSLRSTVEFWVQFGDGEESWVSWSMDIFLTAAYESYCQSLPFLRILNLSAKDAFKHVKELKKSVIVSVAPGDIVFVDLRFDPEWFFGLDGVIAEGLMYKSRLVVIFEYIKWFSDKHKFISAKCKVFGEAYDKLDGYFVYAFGSEKVQPPGSILVDSAFLLAHPGLVASSKRDVLLLSAYDDVHA